MQMGAKGSNTTKNTFKIMARIYIQKYQNKNEQSTAYNKWYARVVHNETMDLDDLCEHISEHGSIYTPDVVTGVVKKFVNCIKEQLLESKKVKLNGLGTFYISMQSTGAETAKKWNVSENVKALHVRFLPDQSQNSTYKASAIRRAAHISDVNALVGIDDPEEEEGEGETQNP